MVFFCFCLGLQECLDYSPLQGIFNRTFSLLRSDKDTGKCPLFYKFFWNQRSLTEPEETFEWDRKCFSKQSCFHCKLLVYPTESRAIIWACTNRPLLMGKAKKILTQLRPSSSPKSSCLQPRRLKRAGGREQSLDAQIQWDPALVSLGFSIRSARGFSHLEPSGPTHLEPAELSKSHFKLWISSRKCLGTQAGYSRDFTNG